MNNTYGYARVSTKEQNLDRQTTALLQFGIPDEMIFKDKASGKDFNRPAWEKLASTLCPGDVLVVKSIDRLGRNYDEIIDVWRGLVKVGSVDIVVLDMPLLDTRRREDNITGEFISDIVLQLLSYVAQVERENIRTRQAEGIAAAKARGVKFGRPAMEKPHGWQKICEACSAGLISKREASRVLGVSFATFNKWYETEEFVHYA